MNALSKIAILALGCSAFAVAAAQGSPIPATVVSVQAGDTLELRAGAKAQVKIRVSVESEYHVQSNPPSASYLIPTALKLGRMPGVTLGKVAYPRGVPFKLEGSDEVLSTYSGSFEISVPVRVSRAARPGGGALKGNLRYQACDEHACYPPTNLAVNVPIRVVKGR